MGDLDNDGFRDLILSDADLVCHANPWPWTPGYGRVLFYRGGPGNALTWAGYLTDASGDTIDIGDCSTPLLRDLNGDGRLDLVLGSYGPKDASNELSTQWRLYLNSSTGAGYRFDGFTLLADASGSPIEASSLIIRDLDRDGLDDLIYTLTPSVRFSWYRNTGSETAPRFEASEPLSFPAGIGIPPEFYELADVTGDGFLDLLSVNMYFPSLCVGIPFTTSVQMPDAALPVNCNAVGMTVVARTLRCSIPAAWGDGVVIVYDSRGKAIVEIGIDNAAHGVKLPATGLYCISVRTVAAQWNTRVTVF